MIFKCFENKKHNVVLAVTICRRFFSPKVRFKFGLWKILPNFINFEFTIFNFTLLEIAYLWGVE